MERRLEGLDIPASPFAKETETTIIGAVLQCPEVYEELKGLTSDCFLRPDMRAAFQALTRLHEKGIEVKPLSLLNEMGQEAESFGGKAWLRDILDKVPRLNTVASYVAQLREQVALREASNEAFSFISEAGQPGAGRSTVQDFQERLKAILEGTAGPGSLRHVSEFTSSYLAQKAKQYETATLAGVPTGLAQLDKVLGGGPVAGNLVVVASRPGGGKTAFALSAALHAALSGHSVGFFTLEMTVEEIMDRAISSLTEIDLRRLRAVIGLDKEEWANIVEATDILENLPLYFEHRPGMSVDDLVVEVRTFCRKTKLDVLFIDQTSFLDAPGQNRRDQVGRITKELKKLSHDVEAPIWLLNQLSRLADVRDAEGDAPEPGLHMLKESGSLEEDADIVIFPWRKCKDNIPTRQAGKTGREVQVEVAYLKVAKQRNGPGGAIVPATFFRSMATYGN